MLACDNPGGQPLRLDGAERVGRTLNLEPRTLNHLLTVLGVQGYAVRFGGPRRAWGTLGLFSASGGRDMPMLVVIAGVTIKARGLVSGSAGFGSDLSVAVGRGASGLSTLSLSLLICKTELGGNGPTWLLAEFSGRFVKIKRKTLRTCPRSLGEAVGPGLPSTVSAATAVRVTGDQTWPRKVVQSLGIQRR